MNLRKRLLNGDLTLAAMISEITNPAIVTMMKTAGADSIFLDLEHGTFDWSAVTAMINLGEACGIYVVVRVPEIRREPIQKVLDAGAHAVVVPMVNTVEQAKEVVRLAKYPPEGDRGIALRRSHSQFQIVADPMSYMQGENADVAIMVQVETVESVSSAEQIAQVDGIDTLFVGPWDLSASAGAPGQTWTENSRRLYSKVMACAHRHKKTAAIHVTDAEQAAELATEGFNYISMATDVAALIDTVSRGTQLIRSAR